jgi:hypothetical protein
MNGKQPIHYDEPQPSRAEIDQLQGPVLLEFGATW